jgi:acyl carrier protein
MAMSRDEIFQKVQEALADALGKDPEEITMAATLMGDLGAESIDFLDIQFRLEKAFNIKIPRGEMVIDPSTLSNPDFVKEGKVTASGLAELKAKMPHCDLTEFEKDPDINKILDLFTVQTLVNYIASKVS